MLPAVAPAPSLSIPPLRIRSMTTPTPMRTETDSMGAVLVASDRYWGAQTERSRDNFRIGVDRFQWGRAVKKALGILKKSTALANGELGQLPADRRLPDR